MLQLDFNIWQLRDLI